MKQNRIQASFIVATACLLCLSSGCNNSQISSVSGRVTLDNEPLPNAEVMFYPQGGGRPATATTDSDGHYELIFGPNKKGALQGPNDVMISLFFSGGEHPPESGVAERVAARRPQIPARYNTETELQVDVRPGNQTFDFDLHSK